MAGGASDLKGPNQALAMRNMLAQHMVRCVLTSTCITSEHVYDNIYLFMIGLLYKIINLLDLHIFCFGFFM